MKKKSTPGTHIFRNGLVQMIRMEESTRIIWVKCDVKLTLQDSVNFRGGNDPCDICQNNPVSVVSFVIFDSLLHVGAT